MRIKNTFDPLHPGTLITTDFMRTRPQVEIITGTKSLYALTVFDQDISGSFHEYDQAIVEIIQEHQAHIVSKDMNANSITHYLNANLQKMKRVRDSLEARYAGAEVDQQRVAFVSVIGSNMRIPGILATATRAISDQNINILATGQSMRQVDIEFVVNEKDYETTICSLHHSLIGQAS